MDINIHFYWRNGPTRPRICFHALTSCKCRLIACFIITLLDFIGKTNDCRHACRPGSPLQNVLVSFITCFLINTVNMLFYWLWDLTLLVCVITVAVKWPSCIVGNVTPCFTLLGQLEKQSKSIQQNQNYQLCYYTRSFYFFKKTWHPFPSMQISNRVTTLWVIYLIRLNKRLHTTRFTPAVILRETWKHFNV